MKSIKKLLLLVLIFSVGNSYAIGKNNKIQQARELMQEGEVLASDTCLDEYLKAQKQLKYMLGLGTFARGAGTAASGAVAAGTWAGAGALAGGAGVATSAAVAGTAAVVGATAGAIVAVPAVAAFGTYSMTKLLQTNYVIKTIVDAHRGRGKSLNKFTKRFLRRNKDARGYMTREAMREIILDLDSSGALCDGSLKKQRRIKKIRTPKARHQLALKKDIYRYIKSTL